MANANNPNGLSPVNSILGAAFSGRIGRYYVPSTDTTAIYIGGVVVPAGSADANGIMSVTGNCTTGAIVIGVVTGVELVTRESTIYRAASTERYLYVADDPNTIFEVQDDNSATPAATDVGNVFDLTAQATGSTVTGRSSIQISWTSKTATGDGTEDVMVIGMVQRPNLTLGANSRWLVKLTNHYFNQDLGK